MNRWLLKSEPDAFSWDQLVAAGVEPWTGVRNHQARANLAAMRRRDRAFFYHSNIGREVVGIAEIVREAYPDPTAAAGSPWVCVDVRPVRKLARPVTLAEMRADAQLAGFALLRLSRLSVVPVSTEHWARVLALAGRTA